MRRLFFKDKDRLFSRFFEFTRHQKRRSDLKCDFSIKWIELSSGGEKWIGRANLAAFKVNGRNFCNRLSVLRLALQDVEIFDPGFLVCSRFEVFPSPFERTRLFLFCRTPCSANDNSDT